MTSDNIWNDVLEAIHIPLFVVNTDRVLVLANRSVISLVRRLGFMESDGVAIGRPLFEAVPKLPASLVARYDELFSTGVPQEDERLYQLEDSVVYIRSNRFPIFSGQEVSHVVTMLTDETALRAGREALKQSEATARAIINSSFESIMLVDRDGTVVMANETAARRLGRSLKDVIGKTSQELLPPDVWRKRQPWIQNVFRSGKSTRHMDARGGMIFDYIMNPVLDESGAVSRIAVFATDVTHSVAAQEELVRIRQAIESSSDAIAMSDMSGTHVFSNRAFEDLFGYSVEQLNEAGGPPAAYSDASHAAEVFDTIKSGASWSGVVHMVTRSGRELLIDLRADAIRDADGKLIGLIGIHTDVTTQRHADEQLRRSEERFRLQFSSIPVPTFIWGREDNDFVLKDFNLAAEKMTRGGIVDFVGRRASEMYKDQPEIQSDLRECFESQATIFREMSYHYHSVPDERFLSVHYVPIPPDLILVHTIDLTDRKRAELELQVAHNELEKKVHERTEALRKQIEFDSLVRRLLTNFASCREAEINDEIRKGLRELAEFTKIESAYTVLVSGDQTSYRVAHSWVKAEWPDYSAMYQNVSFGSNAWLEGKILGAEEVHIGTLDDFPSEAVRERRVYEREGVKSALMVPLMGRGGSIKGAIGLRSYASTIEWKEEHVTWLRTVGDAIANVLERKQAQEDLDKSEQRLFLHVQQTPLAVIEWDTDFRVIRWNPAAQEIFGYSATEATGEHSAFIVPAEARKSVNQVWRDLLKRQGGSRSTNANLTKDGKTIICEWYNTPLTDPEGKVIGVASLAQNVTDRVKAEIDLARAYEQLQVEREALHQKNVALQEMVEQVQESKRTTAAQIQTNLERIVLPVIERIGPRLDPQGQQYLTLVRTSLSDILSPFVSNLESQFKRLSPREVEICELIRRGYDSKQIADLRSSSVQTVLKQRKTIRKKLGLDQKKINLATYLTSTFPAQRKREKRKKTI